MKRSERNQWASAQDLAGLGALMARWLDGDMESSPGYDCQRADLDTVELTRLCVGLCRAGIVTRNSQAADEWDDRGVTMHARAYINAFADDHALERLRISCASANTFVYACRTPARWTRRVAVAMTPIPVVVNAEGLTYAEFDGPIARGDVRRMWPWIGREARRAVIDAWQVTIIAPWGCDLTDLAWPHVWSAGVS